jgi:outer membrane lipoprotein-sorting protein
MSSRSLIAVSLAVLLAASGCAALPALDGGADAPPDEDVAEAFADLETVSATQVSSLESNGTTNQTRAEIRLAMGEDGVRRFNRVLEPDSQAGDVTLVDGEITLIYDASENAVTRVSQAENRGSLQDRSDYYASIVAAARNDSTVSPPGESVSPLPVVPVESAGPSVESDAVEGYEVDYLGTEQVADRRAHGFRMTAVTEATIDVNRTLWLDAEFYYPLRTEQTVAFGDRTYDVSTHLEDVSLNTDLPADAFDWTPPANATVENISLNQETFDSRAALSAAAPFPVPDPDLPDGYEFDSGQVTTENLTQVSVSYAGGDGDTLAVSKFVADRDGSAGSGIDAGENVTIAGKNGTYLVTGQTALATWSCGDAQYNVMATDLDREELLAVAESVACQ